VEILGSKGFVDIPAVLVAEPGPGGRGWGRVTLTSTCICVLPSEVSLKSCPWEGADSAEAGGDSAHEEQQHALPHP